MANTTQKLLIGIGCALFAYAASLCSNHYFEAALLVVIVAMIPMIIAAGTNGMPWLFSPGFFYRFQVIAWVSGIVIFYTMHSKSGNTIAASMIIPAGVALFMYPIMKK